MTSHPDRSTAREPSTATGRARAERRARIVATARERTARGERITFRALEDATGIPASSIHRAFRAPLALPEALAQPELAALRERVERLAPGDVEAALQETVDAVVAWPPALQVLRELEATRQVPAVARLLEALEGVAAGAGPADGALTGEQLVALAVAAAHADGDDPATGESAIVRVIRAGMRALTGDAAHVDAARGDAAPGDADRSGPARSGAPDGGDGPRRLSLQQAAALLGIEREELERRFEAGGYPSATRLGPTWVVDRADLVRPARSPQATSCSASR